MDKADILGQDVTKEEATALYTLAHNDGYDVLVNKILKPIMEACAMATMERQEVDMFEISKLRGKFKLAEDLTELKAETKRAFEKFKK